MQFQRDRCRATTGAHRVTRRGIVDALVLNDRDLWVVVARHGEPIDEWLHGRADDEVAPLRVCRTVRGRGWIVLDNPDPQLDRLLSLLEDLE